MFEVACLIRQSLSGQSLLYLHRVRQQSALSAVSWRSDLHGAAHIQQLRRQIFCSRWTSLVEFFSDPATQSRHHLWSVQTTAKGTLFGKHGRGTLWFLICGALENTYSLIVIYLLTYLIIRRWSSRHSIRHIRKPRAALKLHRFMCYRSEIIADRSFTSQE